MAATKRAADGDLLLKLDDADRTTYRAPRGAQPAVGTQVSLWRLRGTWHVWSPGPFPGTWWVKATDVRAAAMVDLLGPNPSRGLPVVVGMWRDCIAVKSKDIRPAALGGVSRG